MWFSFLYLLMNISICDLSSSQDMEFVKYILSVENNMWYSDSVFDWFKIIKDLDSWEVLACWKIIDHWDAKELASVAVLKKYRWMWFWREIIEYLLSTSKELFIICEEKKIEMYKRFWFDEFFWVLPTSMEKKLEREIEMFPSDNSLVMIYNR